MLAGLFNVHNKIVDNGTKAGCGLNGAAISN
jgi:hypothetical protein